ncbi:MAG: hypothetical protein GQ574_20230 [Crocinitomix sp.]|nr:hypothetical protein [Crocinitomix sp.]
MKNIFILASMLFIVASCGTGKTASTTGTTTGTTTVETDENDQTEDETSDPTNSQNGDALMTRGVIRDKAADGCGFIIQMMVDAETETTTFYEPLKLPVEYQEDGKLIQIEYRLSRRPSNCTLAIPIIIDKILTD